MNIIVVGAGVIGKERIKALETLGENIIAVVDPALKGQKLLYDSNQKMAPIYHNIRDAYLALPLLDDVWVFICTPHHETIHVAEYYLDNGLNILVEKPLGRTIGEYKMILKHRDKEKINVGFNYRFFKGIKQLLQDVKDNIFGKLISVNMVLALGDPPGSEKTWRLDPKKSGRGAILDPGIHLIDLAMVMSDGTLKDAACKEWRGYWKTGIWEEAHLLATGNGVIYNIQSSVNRWRNTFRIEVNGTEGYGIVEGRNRHYGNQTYRRGKRYGWQSGKSQRESEELIIDYDGEDSFLEETHEVLYGTMAATHEDNWRCLKFIDTL